MREAGWLERAGADAERRGRHSHAESGNEGVPQCRPVPWLLQCFKEGIVNEPSRDRPSVAQATSKRSRFITLFQAATKSWTNFCSPSEHP